MKKILSLFACLLLFSIPCFAQVKAFPTAEGWGKNTIGGRGGSVCTVDTLSNGFAVTGPDAGGNYHGTFIGCFHLSIPRNLVFSVSGTIDFTTATVDNYHIFDAGDGVKRIRTGPVGTAYSDYDNVTIACQTSPGGIQFKGNDYTLEIYSSQVIIRGCRFRWGVSLPGDIVGAVGLIGAPYSNAPVHDYIIDHSSIMWANSKSGEYAKIYRGTWQYNLFSETIPTPTGAGLAQLSGTPGEGDQPCDILTNIPPADDGDGFNCYLLPRVSYWRNVYTNMGGRYPKMFRCFNCDWSNNLIWNYGGPYEGTHSSCYGIEMGGAVYPIANASAHLNFENNWYKAGPNSNENNLAGPQCAPNIVWHNKGRLKTIYSDIYDREMNYDSGRGTKVYFNGNRTLACPPPSGCVDDWDAFVQIDLDPEEFRSPFSSRVAATESDWKSSTRFPSPILPLWNANDLVTNLLPVVGSVVPNRDSADAYYINQILANPPCCSDLTGISAGPSGAGGPWPTLTGPTAATDTDHDGIPDFWEDSHGLNKSSAADGSTITASGYSNFEIYINELIDAMSTTGGGSAGALGLPVMSTVIQ